MVPKPIILAASPNVRSAIAKLPSPNYGAVPALFQPRSKKPVKRTRLNTGCKFVNSRRLLAGN